MERGNDRGICKSTNTFNLKAGFSFEKSATHLTLATETKTDSQFFLSSCSLDQPPCSKTKIVKIVLKPVEIPNFQLM